MKNYYEGKKILSHMSARLVPPDKTYPDAICDVIMTEEILYVIEDNFDNTFKHHFEIPLERIVSVCKYTSENPKARDNDNYTPSQVVTAILATLGIILISLKGRKEAGKLYLKVAYKNADDEIKSVFFENCSNIKGMVKAYSRIMKGSI